MYQSRWLLFCESINESPEHWDGSNVRYIIWINEKWREFYKSKGVNHVPICCGMHSKEFDEWLSHNYRNDLIKEIKMKESKELDTIKCVLGIDVRDVIKELARLRSDEIEYYKEFNGVRLSSDKTEEENFVMVTGKTIEEFEKMERENLERIRREKAEHNAKISELTKEYIEKGKELIDPDLMSKWEECVPIRLNDLYHGMELQCCLDIIQSLKDNNDNFEMAYYILRNQGHSGLSRSLVMSMLKRFYRTTVNNKTFYEYVGEK